MKRIERKDIRNVEKYLGVRLSQIWREGDEREDRCDECYGARDAFLYVKEQMYFYKDHGLTDFDVVQLLEEVRDKAPAAEKKGEAYRTGWLEGGKEAVRFINWMVTCYGEKISG